MSRSHQLFRAQAIRLRHLMNQNIPYLQSYDKTTRKEARVRVDSITEQIKQMNELWKIN